MTTISEPGALSATGAAKGAVALGLAAVLAAKSNAQANSPNGSEVASQWKSVTNRLIRRITYGLSPSETQKVEQLGFHGYLNQQLGAHLVRDVNFEVAVKEAFPRTAWSEYDLYDVTDDWNSTSDLQMAGIMRACFSPHQLLERMVEFWFDHFNVNRGATLGRLLLPYVRNAIRPNALGKFHNLLSAVCHSPAMLTYLNNDSNEANRSNVNFARELFELHTMGPGGGYTNQDLDQTALIFTGWKWVRDDNAADRGKFFFNAEQHQPGDKTVMGATFRSDGQMEGERFIGFLADHPNTAKHITKKLVLWFLGPTLNNAAWQAAETAFISTGGDIRAVLLAILTPENLAVVDAKFKRPFHLVASAVRAMVCEVTRYDYLKDAHIKPAGHMQYEWYPPNGYPDTFEYWGHSLGPRYAFACSISNNSIVGVSTNIDGYYGAIRTPEGVFNAINSIIFSREMSVGDRMCLLALLNRGEIGFDRLRAALAFAIACPSFQWY